MSQLVFFLEEESARQMLLEFLPRILPQNCIVERYFVYRGKSDLQKNIMKDLRRYRNTDAKCILLHDQDMSDCYTLKNNLRRICAESGKDIIIRIACRELESWYLAQLHAVEKAFEINGIAQKQEKRTFRTPDKLTTPDLILKNITKGKYAKLSGSRKIGKYLNPDDTRSISFKHFIVAVRSLVENN